mgnify:FL=1
MATQRSSIVCSILSLALTAIAWALPARGADPDSQSAPAMKLPEWIENAASSPATGTPLVRTAGEPQPAPAAPPQPNGFRRWISERFATLPPATTPAPAAAGWHGLR